MRTQYWISEVLKDKKVFVFDWDGTLFDSMVVKSRNFGQAFCSIFPGEPLSGFEDQVRSQYQLLSGRPRKIIFMKIMDILGVKADLDTYQLFNDNFEKLNKTTLRSSQIFPDALTLLEVLIKRGFPIFISSSVPPQELSDLVEATLPTSVKAGITSVLGSTDDHNKGVEHLRLIADQTLIQFSKIIVIGDDLADHELSTEAGVECIVINRLGTLNRHDIVIIDSLTQIIDGLPK